MTPVSLKANRPYAQLQFRDALEASQQESASEIRMEMTLWDTIFLLGRKRGTFLDAMRTQGACCSKNLSRWAVRISGWSIGISVLLSSTQTSSVFS